jgi:hypothetical protein
MVHYTKQKSKNLLKIMVHLDDLKRCSVPVPQVAPIVFMLSKIH